MANLSKDEYARNIDEADVRVWYALSFVSLHSRSTGLDSFIWHTTTGRGTLLSALCGGRRHDSLTYLKASYASVAWKFEAGGIDR